MPDMTEFGTLIKDLPENIPPEKRWKVFIDGKEVENACRIRIFNERFGELNYGLSPVGQFAQWAFHEIGGGGSVNVPYAIVDGILLIGVLPENRPFQGGMVENLPRGFLDPGENHFETAVRETLEEVGVDVSGRIRELSGKPVNPNSAFFETAAQGEGGMFFSVRFYDEELVEGEEIRLDPSVVRAATMQAEKMMTVRFIPWIEAVKLGDMFTLAGIGRLLGQLAEKQLLAVEFEA
ncbi:MAG: NUDIX domain-containing protein [Patescibacteria group bacterium]